MRPADICDARAIRLAQAYTIMAGAWRDYVAGKVRREPCDDCGGWVPASGTVSFQDLQDDVDVTVLCVICAAKRP